MLSRSQEDRGRWVFAYQWISVCFDISRPACSKTCDRSKAHLIPTPTLTWSQITCLRPPDICPKQLRVTHQHQQTWHLLSVTCRKWRLLICTVSTVQPVDQLQLFWLYLLHITQSCCLWTVTRRAITFTSCQMLQMITSKCLDKRWLDINSSVALRLKWDSIQKICFCDHEDKNASKMKCD